jgi:hypothetical protein
MDFSRLLQLLDAKDRFASALLAEPSNHPVENSMAIGSVSSMRRQVALYQAGDTAVVQGSNNNEETPNSAELKTQDNTNLISSMRASLVFASSVCFSIRTFIYADIV